MPTLSTPPQTVAELWAGFDPTAEPLDTEILHQWEEDGVTLRVVRYRVGIFKGETAMVAGVYGFPTGQTNLPGLLNIHGGGQFADYKSCLTNAKRGYATLTVAWAGRIGAPGYTVGPAEMQLFFDDATGDPNYKVTTDWGPLEGYHAPNRFAGSTNVSDLLPADWTFDDVESPRNNTWFLWTMAARRGLTFLEQQPEVDGARLGVYGHSMGGKLTVMTAGSDDRVKAAAPSCGGVSDNDKAPYYDATIGDFPYLERISCPVFFLKPANDFHSHIADVPASIDAVEPNDWRVTTSPHHNHQDTARYSVATQLWMDQHLKAGSALPDSPELQLALDNQSGVPSVSITGDISSQVQSVEVYYTQQGEDAGETHSFGDFAFRHWHSATVQGGNGLWTAELPVHSVDEPLWVFANVSYGLDSAITGAGYYYNSYTADSFVLSTPLEMAASAELQAASVSATFPATPLIEDFQGDWQQEWFNYSDDPNVWQTTTHKVNDPVYAAPQYSKLAFEVRSEEANTLVVRLNDAAVEVELPGGPEWQEIVLYPLDFETALGTWAFDWEEAKELEFSHYEAVASYTPGGGTMVVGNPVWNGTAPEFRDLHWAAGTRAELDALRPNKLLQLPVEDGKVYLTVESAEEVTDGYDTINDTWFFGAPLVVDGVTYPRGLTTHAPAETVYFLGSAFERFKAIATANSSLGTPLQMKVYLDEVLAFDSGDLVTSWTALDLDVSGVSVMRLVVSYTGGSANGVHASWVDAHLSLPPSSSQVIFTEDFEGYGAPGGTGWDDFSGAFVDSSLGFSGSIPGAVFQGANLLWFDSATDPLGAFVPYPGTTSADDPAGIEETYAALSGTQDVEVAFAGATGQTFVEGTQYDLGFLYFNRPNLAGMAFVAELYQVGTGTAVATTSEFAEISLNAFEFIEAGLSYTATALDAGAEIGIRFRGTPATTNINQLCLDNISLTATVPEPDPGMSSTDELAFAGDVSGSDLLDGIMATTTGVWITSAGFLNDGDHGRSYDTVQTQEGAWGTVGAVATFELGAGTNGAGYDITSIQSIAAWNGGGFRNQAWTVEVKPVGGNWTALGSVDYQPFSDTDAGPGATKYTLSDSSGILATGIEAIRFTTNPVGGGSNGGAFIWREVDVFGEPTSAPDGTGLSSATELAYAGDVSDSDLLHGLTPTGAGFAFVDRLNDGDHGLSYDTTGTTEATSTTVGATADFRLGYGTNGTGYDITSIQSIAAWNGGGFGNQAWTVEVKRVGGDWITLDTVDYQPIGELDGPGATKFILSGPTGVLATGVERIRFTTNSVDNIVDSGAFLWRELDVFGTPTAAEAVPVPPTLLSVSPDTPVDGSVRSNVSTRTKLVARFDEAVELGSGDITIVNLDTATETVISLPDLQVTIDPIESSLLLIEPGFDLAENTRYAVRIDPTAIDDRSGNSFAGIPDNVTWTFSTARADPLQILCIGDSITVGYTDNLAGEPFNFGYRGHLYKLLTDAGYVFQFVGDSPQPWNGAFGLDPTIGGSYKPDFDLRELDQDYHQGGEGATIQAIGNWFQSVDPDVVLLMIGINGISVESPAKLNGLVNEIVTQKPDAHVIVAQITPYVNTQPALNQLVYDYNVYIRDTLIPTFTAAGHNVSTVDMYSLFLTDPENHEASIAEGVHSNYFNHPWNSGVAGYDAMARRWFEGIEALDLIDPVPIAGRTRVFLLAGQSNMNGLGSNADLAPPYDAAQTDVAFWDNGEWVDLAPGFGNSSAEFGPEVSFGHTLKEALGPDRIHLVKYAVNGTALYNDWAPPTGPQYAAFMSTANAAIADLDANGVDYEISGMLWLQGESDAAEGQGAAYETNLRNFIADMRSQFEVPDLPFYLARVRDFYGTPEQAGLVRAAQVTVAESTDKVEWFDTDSYNPLIAGGHYNAEGEINIGIDYANLYLESGPSGTFADWAAGRGLDGTPGKESGFSDDPDLDGVVNLWEWIGGGNPLVSDAGLHPHAGVPGSNSEFSFTFSREEDSIGRANLLVEWATDLPSSWSNSFEVFEYISGTYSKSNGFSVTIDDTTDPDSITVSMPYSAAEEGRMFFRLKASHP